MDPLGPLDQTYPWKPSLHTQSHEALFYTVRWCYKKIVLGTMYYPQFRLDRENKKESSVESRPGNTTWGKRSNHVSLVSCGIQLSPFRPAKPQVQFPAVRMKLAPGGCFAEPPSSSWSLSAFGVTDRCTGQEAGGHVVPGCGGGRVPGAVHQPNSSQQTTAPFESSPWPSSGRPSPSIWTTLPLPLNWWRLEPREASGFGRHLWAICLINERQEGDKEKRD